MKLWQKFLLALGSIPAALGAVDYDLQLTQSGLNLAADGLEVVSFARIIAVEPPWGHKYFFNAYTKLEQTQDGNKIVQTYKSNDFSLNAYSAEEVGNDIVVTLDVTMLKNEPAHLEYCSLLIPAKTLGAAAYKATLKDGRIVEGKLDEVPPHFTTEFIEDAVKVVFYGDCGVLTVTSNDGNTFNINDARNSGACWGDWYTAVKGILFVSTAELEPQERFVNRFTLNFEMKPGLEFQQPLTPGSSEVKNVALDDISGDAAAIEEPVLPTIKKWTKADGFYLPADGCANKVVWVTELNSEEQKKFENAVARVTGTLFDSAKTGSGEGIFVNIAGDAENTPEHPEGYYMKVTPEKVVINARTPRGAFYALQSLRATKARCGEMTDWPDLDMRANLIMVDSDSLRVQKEFIDKLYAPGKINTLFIECEYAAWDSLKPVRQEWAMSKEDLKELVEYARANYIEVIPLFQSLGHCEWLFKNGQNIDLAENPGTLNVYNVRNPEVHKLMTRVLDEVVELFQPNMLHIGHDEVGNETNYPFQEANRKEGGAKLIMDDIMFYYDYCQKHNMKMMMWHDMFIRTPQKPHGSFGLAEERLKLPRDIYFAFWDYGATVDENTVRELHEEGFPVVLCGWDSTANIRKLTKLAKESGSTGYMTTIWAGYDGSATIFQREFNQVAAYIAGSARAWNTAEEANNFSAGHELTRRFFPEVLQNDELGAGVMLDLSNSANLILDPEEYPFGMENISGACEVNEHLDELNVQFMPMIRNGKPAAITVKSPNNPVFPESVIIPVNSKADKLYILHTFMPRMDVTYLGTVVAEYTVNYDDNTSVTIPVKHGSDIAMPYNDCNLALPMKHSLKSGDSRFWYMTLVNPHPEKQINSIVLNGKTYPYYLFAITIEK